MFFLRMTYYVKIIMVKEFRENNVEYLLKNEKKIDFFSKSEELFQHLLHLKKSKCEHTFTAQIFKYYAFRMIVLGISSKLRE